MVHMLSPRCGQYVPFTPPTTHAEKTTPCVSTNSVDSIQFKESTDQSSGSTMSLEEMVKLKEILSQPLTVSEKPIKELSLPDVTQPHIPFPTSSLREDNSNTHCGVSPEKHVMKKTTKEQKDREIAAKAKTRVEKTTKVNSTKEEIHKVKETFSKVQATTEKTSEESSCMEPINEERVVERIPTKEHIVKDVTAESEFTKKQTSSGKSVTGSTTKEEDTVENSSMDKHTMEESTLEEIYRAAVCPEELPPLSVTPPPPPPPKELPTPYQCGPYSPISPPASDQLPPQAPLVKAEPAASGIMELLREAYESSPRLLAQQSTPINCSNSRTTKLGFKTRQKMLFTTDSAAEENEIKFKSPIVYDYNHKTNQAIITDTQLKHQAEKKHNTPKNPFQCNKEVVSFSHCKFNFLSMIF